MGLEGLITCCILSEIDVYLPSFSRSFLEFDSRVTSSLSTFTDIELVFRASSADGLLLYTGDPLLTLNSRDLELDLDHHCLLTTTVSSISLIWPMMSA